MKVMITGISSGLGEALAKHYAGAGAEVYGLSRRVPDPVEHMTHVRCDLGDLDSIHEALFALLDDMTALDLVVLNAGMLGRIQCMSACRMDELKAQMDVNLWANKIILDYLIKRSINIKQIIAISSGASQSGSLGWNGYSLSKAALNMLIKLYANEMPNTHLVALAPGLVETPMLGSILCGDHDVRNYTTVQRLRDSKEGGLVLPPEETAKRIAERREELLTVASGSYVDIRNL